MFVTGKCPLFVQLLSQRKLHLQEKFMRALVPSKESQWMTRNSSHSGTSPSKLCMAIVWLGSKMQDQALQFTRFLFPLSFNHIASQSPLTLVQYLKHVLVHRTLRNLKESGQYLWSLMYYTKNQGLVMPWKVILMTAEISF